MRHGAMAAHVLVVANVTAASRRPARRAAGSAPSGPDRVDAGDAGQGPGFAGREAVASGSTRRSPRWREAGLEAEGVDRRRRTRSTRCTRLGTRAPRRGDRLHAARARARSWLQYDFPHRVAPVHRPRRHARRSRTTAASRARGPPPAHEKPALGPLSVLRSAALPLTQRGQRRPDPRRPAAARARARRRGREPEADDPRLVDSSGGQPAAEPGPRRGAQRGGRARGELGRVVGQRAPVDDAAADDPERVGARRVARVRREHEPRAGVGGAQHAAEAGRAATRAARGGAAARPRARSGARPRPRASARRRGRAAPPRRRPRDEQPQRRVEPLAVEVRVEVAEARRQAAAHLPVGRRVRRGAAARARSGAARTAS